MKLRTYLIKRTIHMIITMLIVLILLFVLYRMMPGSAAATLMMKPGMTQSEIDMVMVRYGFGKWADYPGEYVTRQIDVDQIGRYSVTVNAESADGSTDSFVMGIDVNTPYSADMLPPTILDIGLEPGPPPGLGSPAHFYVVAFDESAVRTVNAELTYPNSSALNPLVKYTETLTFRQDLARSNETSNVYYYNVTTPALVSGASDSLYTLNVEATDYARNVGTAALGYDAAATSITSMIWNLTTDISYTNGLYSYLSTGSVGVGANVTSAGTPTFSMTLADGSTSSTAPSLTAVGSRYDGTYPVSDIGKIRYEVSADGLSAYTSFPVNSAAGSLSTVQDDDSGYPLLQDLTVSYADPDSTGYPFVLEGSSVNLMINATVVDADGKQSPIITATILMPDGEIMGAGDNILHLTHPIYVKDIGLPEQFVTYMKTMLVFDFGTSFHYNQPVWDVIVDRIPSTALLFGTSLVIAYIIGILIGVMVAWRRGTVLELGTIVVTLFFYSMPIFWFALIMQWLFYAELGWFPIGTMGGFTADGTPLHGIAYVKDILWHLVLPLVTLTILSLAGTILLMRSSMLEVIGEDFITTAKAKGLKERRVIYRHAARNAMLPVVTSMAMSIGGVISGGILTETIFSWYGMGTLLVSATLQHDFPVVQGAFYILALLTVLGNMGADILYAYLDPRVQL